MSNSRRLSQSITGSWREANETPPLVNPSDEDLEDWLTTWRTVFARDLIDSRVVSVDSETSVEEACDLLLTEDIPCLAVRTQNSQPGPYHGLFDFADVNAFLTLAATRHTLLPDDLRGKSRVNDIVSAAKAGRVPVHLVSNLSDKNPIEALPYNSTLISLLAIFSRGAHRTLIQAADNPEEFIGMVSDRRLLAWFDSYARETASFKNYLSNPVHSLSLPSLNLNVAVVSAAASASILDAMKLMSDEGVSSIAVVEEHSATLLSAVSVTDIGKIVVPSQSNQILATPLHHFVAQIKDPDGSTDGVDKYPVYSVFPSSLLSYTMEKLLASNKCPSRICHQRNYHQFSDNDVLILWQFDWDRFSRGQTPVLSLFARLAKIPNVDPTQMQRHRRASSASSSQSSLSDREVFLRSRSNSRTSIRHSPTVIASSPPGFSILDGTRTSSTVPVLDLSLQRKESRKSVKGKRDNH